ncbi:TetR family transcriptional regulator [Nonomuraea sp. NPDC048901]|uniref:SbtR family transcriptional regulator n=1 Tax=Nonomuraea sp. NPDC048901 TaxID=3155627 RepID=UPI0033E1566A
MMRADALRNRERIVRVARAVFTEHGPDSSLNQVAQQAEVGPGTLYRHFPTLQDLLVAVIRDDVAALCAQGQALLSEASALPETSTSSGASAPSRAPAPSGISAPSGASAPSEASAPSGASAISGASADAALRAWLRAVAVHATAMRGLVATQLASWPADGALAACHEEITATGAALLDHARRAGSAPDGLDITDLLRLANAIGWASEQSPDDEGLIDRLLSLVTTTSAPNDADRPLAPPDR